MLRFSQSFSANKENNDIVCHFINDRLIDLMDYEIGLYAKPNENGEFDIDYADLFDDSFLYILERHFPPHYDRNKMGYTFMSLYMYLKSEEEYVPQLTMEYVLANLIQNRINFYHDSGMSLIETVPCHQELYDEYMNELTDSAESNDEKIAIVNERLADIENMENYFDTCFWDMDYKILDTMTEDELRRSGLCEELGIDVPENIRFKITL